MFFDADSQWMVKALVAVVPEVEIGPLQAASVWPYPSLAAAAPAAQVAAPAVPVAAPAAAVDLPGIEWNLSPVYLLALV